MSPLHPYVPPILRGRLTTSEAVREFDLSAATLSRWRRKLGIAPIKFGLQSFWTRDDLERIAAARMNGAAPEPVAETDPIKILETALAAAKRARA